MHLVQGTCLFAWSGIYSAYGAADLIVEAEVFAFECRHVYHYRS